MINKVLLITSIVFLSCGQAKKMAETTTQKTFEITSCKVTYGGDSLPFEKPIEDWIKFFGGNYRKYQQNTYVWDSLGISLIKGKIWNDTMKESSNATFYIHFANLNHPVAGMGKFYLAREFRSVEGLLYHNFGMYNKTPNKEDSIWAKKAAALQNFKEYQYPFKIHSSPVLADSAPIQAGMNLAEVNEKRLQIKSNGKIVYQWMGPEYTDKDTYRGSTNAKTGVFTELSETRYHSHCVKKDKYVISYELRFSEGVLEYIKINNTYDL